MYLSISQTWVLFLYFLAFSFITTFGVAQLDAITNVLASDFSGPVVSVLDGDTIEVLHKQLPVSFS